MCQAWKEIMEDCEKKGEICAVYKINMTIVIDTIYCIAPVAWIVANT